MAEKFPSATVERLRATVVGRVTVPGDRAYDKERKTWLEVVEQRPSVIVNARAVEDIVAAVNAARELDLPLGVQNSGHGIAAPCNDGILLRLSEMNEVTVDAAAETATVGPGVSSGELLKAAEPHGMAYPSGQVSNVGVIGYTLGGGYGWLGRQEGAACAAMLSATVVLADGRVVTASTRENADLFWALRGGGGNFGVVASMTVKLTRVGPIFGGLAYFRREDAEEVLRFYRQWSAGLGDATSTYLQLTKLPPKPNLLLHLRSTEACVLGVCHTDLHTAEKLHGEIRAFKEPALDDLKVRPYAEMASFDLASGEEHATTFSHVECVELTDEVMERALAVAKRYIPPIIILELQQLGGAMVRAPREDMAFCAPKAGFYFKLIAPKVEAPLETLALLAKEAIREMGDVFTGELSMNWMRGDQQHLLAKAFTPETYARLKDVKRQYDPGNLFHLNLNLAPQ